MLFQIIYIFFPAKLAKKLKTSEEPQYEGMCHLAIARCEQSIGNSNGEAEALISASRCHILGEKMSSKNSVISIMPLFRKIFKESRHTNRIDIGSNH